MVRTETPKVVAHSAWLSSATFNRRKGDFSFPIRSRGYQPPESHWWDRDLATVIRVATRFGIQVTQPSGSLLSTPCTIAEVVSEDDVAELPPVPI